eukprot:5993864-Pleurochrysis_carterae.AAC.4
MHPCLFVWYKCGDFYSFRFHYALANPSCCANTHARYSATPSNGRRPACTPLPWHASAPASLHKHTQY